MGDARGCRGGFRRGLRRCRLAPRCRSLCCRLMASALFGMRAAPSRRNGGPRPSSALPLFRCRRPRLRSWRRQRGAKACAPAAGFRCAPLCPCCAVSRGSGGGRPLRQAPAIPFFFGAVAVGSYGATPPPSPRSPVLLRAAKVGGLASAAFGRRAAAAARPSAPAPPPGFGPGAGLFCFRCGGFGDCAACGRR